MAASRTQSEIASTHTHTRTASVHFTLICGGIVVGVSCCWWYREPLDGLPFYCCLAVVGCFWSVSSSATAWKAKVIEPGPPSGVCAWCLYHKYPEGEVSSAAVKP